MNQQYMKDLPAEEVASHLVWHFENQGIDTTNGPKLASIVEIQAERVKTLKEMAEISTYFYQDFEQLDEKAAKKHLRPVAKDALVLVQQKLEAITEWTGDNIQAAINLTAEELDVGMGKVGMPLRVAATGSGNSPSLDVTLVLLDKNKVISRISVALEYIAAREAAQ
jgi:glutamyl-tRNA synthetase